MIDRSHDLPLMRQAEVLGLSQSSLCYQPRPVSATDLAIIHAQATVIGTRKATRLQPSGHDQDLSSGRSEPATAAGTAYVRPASWE